MTATDELASILAKILAEPDEDTHRLVYADRLDERGGPGDAERAEFIRVQCTCARLPEPCFQTRSLISDAADYDNGRCVECSGMLPEICVYHKTLKRAESLFDSFGLGEERSRTFGVPDDWYTTDAPEWVPVPGGPWSGLVHIVRGFPNSVTCTAEQWLAHADALVIQTIKCEECDGSGKVNEWTPFGPDVWVKCSDCKGAGRLLGTFQPTAQPITKVTLTTMPEYGLLLGNRLLIQKQGGVNDWECETWPGIKFNLPPEPV